MKEKILVVAAHPDDDILGCGGTLKKLKNNNAHITVVYFTDGVTSRENYTQKDKLFRKSNAEKAAKIIGYNKIIHFDLHDQRLDEYPLISLTQKLEKVLFKLKPTTIFTHFHNDLNADHQIVNKVVLTATRPNIHFCISKILFFEVLSSTEWNYNNSINFSPNYFVNISITLDDKIDAFKKYTKEIRKYPHPRSIEGIKNLAKYRGMQAGINYSEAFMLGRIIS